MGSGTGWETGHVCDVETVGGDDRVGGPVEILVTVVENVLVLSERNLVSQGRSRDNRKTWTIEKHHYSTTGHVISYKLS